MGMLKMLQMLLARAGRSPEDGRINPRRNTKNIKGEKNAFSFARKQHLQHYAAVAFEARWVSA